MKKIVFQNEFQLRSTKFVLKEIVYLWCSIDTKEKHSSSNHVKTPKDEQDNECVEEEEISTKIHPLLWNSTRQKLLLDNSET